MAGTKRSLHTCSAGCGCRSWACATCGTRNLVDRQARYETEEASPSQYAPELCEECGAPLCDTCVLENLHRCEEDDSYNCRAGVS